ncbi:hypothetical protein [Salmonella phage SSBI34]|nr:hypothetical protein [Salmonella phage SSBI34]
MWQFYVLLVLNSLSFLGVLTCLLGGKSGPGFGKHMTPGAIFILTLFCAFGMWLSYSLYSAAPFVLGTSIVVLHWSSAVYHWIKVMATQRSPDSTVGTVLYSLAYSFTMLILLISYGVNFLW